MSAGNQRVMVAVRVRPVISGGAQLQDQEKFELQGVYRTGDTTLKVEQTKPGEPARSSMFTFDYIFDQESTQLEVYEDCVVEMVDAALVGLSGTMLAYGQTGSGKTFSVLGDVKPNPLENDLLTTNSGMFLRVLSDLMDYKQRQLKKGWHVVVGLSCVEVYNTNIRDLFGGKAGSEPPTLTPVIVGDDVHLPNLIIKEMTTLQAVFNEIQLAISRRRSRDTDANSGSSRSHCLFTIDILQQAASAPAPSVDILSFDRKTAEEKSSRRSAVPTVSPTSKKGGAAMPAQDKLHSWEMPFQGMTYRMPGQKELVYMSKIILADLAGSERIARTHVTGTALKEAMAINTSLTTLGNVVHSLHEGTFVGYRDSRLTQLLKPTFSQPSSRVFLLAQCSPTQLTYDETISTLHFANKVKAMKVTTATGAEAEKLQFDFIELSKTYDSIVADLHIFAVQESAKPAVIRRRVTQNSGIYYDRAAAGKAKITTKDRRTAVDSMGAVTVAQQERQALIAQQEKEKSEEAVRTRKAIDESRDDLASEHKANMSETQESIQQEMEMRLHHASQETLLDVAAAGNQIVAEEAAAWAALQNVYLREHRAACEKELGKSQAQFERMSQEMNKLRLSANTHETPETVADDEQYALAAWGHNTAKRFFSSCMEIREDQMRLLAITGGNIALEKWQIENQDVLRKFNEENTA